MIVIDLYHDRDTACIMLRTAVERRLAEAGWKFQRETTYHRVWSKGNVRIPVPNIDGSLGRSVGDFGVPILLLPYRARGRRRRSAEASEPQGRALSPVGPKRSGGGAKRLDRAASRRLRGPVVRGDLEKHRSRNSSEASNRADLWGYCRSALQRQVTGYRMRSRELRS